MRNYNCNKCRDKNWLVECACGCNIVITLRNRKCIERKFINGHKNQKGSNNPSWKGGRAHHHGYWHLWMPDYYRSSKVGYVPEHVYFYEQYHKLCMLPWGEVHHIIPVKKGGSNLPYNLMGMMKKDHVRMHNKNNKYNYNKHIDTSDRRCYSCRTDKTYIKKPKKKSHTPCPIWHHLPWDKINWYCDKCARRERHNNKIKI